MRYHLTLVSVYTDDCLLELTLPDPAQRQLSVCVSVCVRGVGDEKAEDRGNYIIRGMEVPQKLKLELPYDPAVPLLGIYLDKTVIQKDTCTPMFIAALFTVAKTWKPLKCPPTNE